ncbi:aminopeptidase P family protein [Flavobacterium sp. NKUCC04_CG]|uniref:aminopeptidase P family protein n=1 Tax=Flavobacterium sp. NKUCC04_CG TaxID=2842121 RepID=UPI001C5AB8B4|nr:aminopeptidase P family protein [Flavobacterium sp. NKUCC04_CG]MBW3518598.1 aminopeptidase P family protein [Flavobacterium sp. NKUCC04_CG]
MKHLEKLAAIRELMAKNSIDAYIVPSSDPHISEYLPEHYRCISWISGFTGSAGTLMITKDFAGLWTDSRYFVQANQQLEESGFELVKLKVQHAPEFATWLAERFTAGQTVAFDGNLASLMVANSVKSLLEPLGVKVNGHVDLLGPIWENRPSLPTNPAYLLPTESTGQSTIDKLTEVRAEMKKQHADAHLISSLDDVAWLLNIRGTDVNCNPVVLAFVYLTQTEAHLYIAAGKLTAAAILDLKNSGVEVQAYVSVYKLIPTLNVSSILLDPKRSCYAVYDSIPKQVRIIESLNPSTLLKSVKNEVELNFIRQTMVNDGVAMTKFFKWVEENVASGDLSEMSIADKLQALRAEQPGFKDISFGTIAGYKDHGALPHYNADKVSNYQLASSGLLLVDSGGQYLTGTTDITRVISLGEMTAEEKEDYTIVLKGTIEGSMAVFTKGTRGYQIDAITRRPIWATKRNYNHGTGHGVGFFLNVHEGPHTFNGAAVDVALLDGMVSSIEPGLYREGKHGIRIENLVVSKTIESNQFGEFMDFETLTICYIDTSLVEKALLHQEHIDWLNNYNQWVFDKISSKLNEEEQNWLRLKTKAI